MSEPEKDSYLELVSDELKHPNILVVTDKADRVRLTIKIEKGHFSKNEKVDILNILNQFVETLYVSIHCGSSTTGFFMGLLISLMNTFKARFLPKSKIVKSNGEFN